MANYRIRVGSLNSFTLQASGGVYTLTGQDAFTGYSADTIPLLATSEPAANWSSVFTKDFEDNTVSGAEFFTTTGNIRAVTLTNPISGTRSQRIGCTGFPPGARCAVVHDLSTWLNSATANKRRFRATGKVKAETGSTEIFLGVNSSGTSNYVCYDRVTVTTTPTTFTWTFTWPFAANGTFRVDMTEATVIVVDDFLVEEDLNYTGLVSADTVNTTIPADGFGVHLNQAHVSGSQSGPNVNYTRVRGHALCNWNYGEPTEGAYTNAYLDAHSAAVNAHSGAVFLHTLSYVPTWSTTGGTRTEIPMVSKQNAAKAYFDQVLSRFLAGKVKYVELWNEIGQASSYTDTAANLVAWGQLMYPYIKGKDPSIVVIGPNFEHLGMKAAEGFLRGGGDAYCDAYSIHAYANLVGAHGIASWAYNFRQVLTRFGVSTSKPIYHTETCTAANPSADLFATTMLTSFASGLNSYEWYMLEGFYAAGTALATGADYSTNTNLGDAFNTVKSWISNHTRVGCYRSNTLGVWHMILARPGGGTRVVAWADAGTVTVKGQSSWGITTSHTLTGSTATVPYQGGLPVFSLSTSPMMFDNGL